MEIYFTEKGQLFFDGYDIGKTVKKIWGDSDYEYTYTIEPGQVPVLCNILGIQPGDQVALLLEIKNRFAGNKAYSMFGDFLKTHNIQHQRFTWA